MQLENKDKHCRKCGHKGPDNDFSKSYGRGANWRLRGWCNECRRAYDRRRYNERGGAAFQRQWLQKNRAKALETKRRSYRLHRVQRIADVRKWRKEHPDRVKDINQKSRAKLKAEVVAAYGSKCSCCGETELVFLTVEHINHDGKQHAKQVGPGAGVYRDLRRRGFPKDGYTVFCWNCQMATRFGELCPHKIAS